jgi:predicted aspartyl protease
MTRRSIALGGLAHAACATSFAGAQTLDAPLIMPQDLVVTPGLLGTVGTNTNADGRISAPVFVNGMGPFRFFVDTGANRSALSMRLAQRIGAVSGGEAEVHGVSGVRMAPMVRVNSIRSGAFEMRDRDLPILSDDLIEPADGILGVDGFNGLRLEFDNRFRTMNVRHSSRGWPTGYTMRADLKFGQLVSARGRIGDLQLPIVFDTGTDIGLANNALREALTAPSRRAASALTGSRLTNAAQPIFVDNVVTIPKIALQDCVLNNAVAIVGDFHIFELWGLVEKPAMIIGMGVLNTLKSFAIDYGRKELQFRP